MTAMKILVWGTGTYAADFLEKYRFLPYVDGFVGGKEPSDAFREKFMEGKTWHRSSVLEHLSFDVLLIAAYNPKFIREMLAECENKKIPGEKVVVLADLESPSRPEMRNQAASVVFDLLRRPFVPFTASSFTEEWRRYYYLHEAEIPEKIQRLAIGLDAESVEMVRLMIERKSRLCPLHSCSKFFLANFTSLATEAEQLSSSQSPKWEERAWSEYGLPAELPLEFSVFNYHSGLCFLSQVARDSLRGRAVIDGGAYWGDSALVFEKYHPSSIHSFEPMTIRLLERTVRERNLSNVIPINMGLGDEDGGEIDCYYHAQFADAMGMDAAASVIDKHNGHYDTQKIHITTIDAYAQRNCLDVGLIKLDVEGVELDVIRGALETIRSSKPVLLISIYHMPRDLFEIKPLIESLGLSYHFMIRHLSTQLDNEYMLIGHPL